MGQSGPLELGVAQIAKPGRLQAGPPELVTRDGRFDRDERVILEGPEQTPRFRRFPWHVWSLLFCQIERRTLPPNDRTYATDQQPVSPQATLAVGEELYAVQ